jgi:hypothetical protein
MSEEKDGREHKWIFRYEVDGGIKYSAPGELSELLELVKERKLEGEFCLAIIIPDFKSETTCKIDVSKSKYIKKDSVSAEVVSE